MPLGQPLWKLGFFPKARRDGTWDRWIDVTLQWHCEAKGMMEAVDTPVAPLATVVPPELLVARLTSFPVKVTCPQSH